jgi:arginine:pyruvate transaminase
MRFSPLVDRIGGRRVAAWDLHKQAAAAERRGEDVIVLSVGDPDFATPAPIVEAAVAALRAGDTHYTELAGRPALRAAIAREHERRSGQKVAPENTIFLAGAQNGVAFSALCLCAPGDEVLVPEPMYLTYEASIGLAGATMVPVPQQRETGFRLDVEALHRAVTPRTRALFFATPCNPTGAVMGRDELETIAALARAQDLWVVADEAYATLAFERPHLSIAALPGMAARTVTLGSLSKSHAMAGWRAGWAVGPEDLIGHMTNLALCTLYGLPGFIQEAARVALDEGGAAREAMRETYRRRRDQLYDRLAAVEGLHCLRPEAGMFMLADIGATGLAAQDFAWRLYRETGVAVLDAGAFGTSAEGCVRISFVAGEDRLAEAARRIGRFVAGLMGPP